MAKSFGLSQLVNSLFLSATGTPRRSTGEKSSRRTSVTITRLPVFFSTLSASCLTPSDFPTPGGPTKHRIGPRRAFSPSLSCFMRQTARYSITRSLTCFMP